MDVLFDLIMSPNKPTKRRSPSPSKSRNDMYLPLPTGLSQNKYYRPNKLITRRNGLYCVLLTVVGLLIIAFVLPDKMSSAIAKTHTFINSPRKQHQDSTVDHIANSADKVSVAHIPPPIDAEHLPDNAVRQTTSAEPPHNHGITKNTDTQSNDRSADAAISDTLQKIDRTPIDANADIVAAKESSVQDIKLPQQRQTTVNMDQLRKTVSDANNIVDDVKRPVRAHMMSEVADTSYDQLTLQQKQQHIKQSMLHGYSHYVDKCIGQDDLNPISNTCQTWVGQHNTLIDSLSTLHVMGLTDEFNQATQYIEKHMQPESTDRDVSFFETTIRVLGGLLAAYDTSSDKMYLQKAVKLADRLKLVFDADTGLPKPIINTKTGVAKIYQWSSGATMLSEVGTFQLEFYYLSHHTGDPQYQRLADTVYDWFVSHSSDSKDGLYPAHVDSAKGEFKNKDYMMGGMADSFYEYLLKLWLATGKTNMVLQQLYLDSMHGMFTHMYHEAGGEAWLADVHTNTETHVMQHLVCFIPGLLALGVTHGIASDHPDIEKLHMDAAVKLTATCNKFYTMTPTGLAPEAIAFNINTGFMTVSEPAYKLRPEVLESITIMHRLTGDDMYRQWGWSIYQAIERHAKVEYGYSGLKDCRQVDSLDDRMESYFFAETLKYLYMLFSDSSVVPLTGEIGEYVVLNTEAHPLKSWKQASDGRKAIDRARRQDKSHVQDVEDAVS